MTGAKRLHDSLVLAREVPPTGACWRGEADDTTRASIAERAGLVAVDSLRYDFVVRPWRRIGLIAEGSIGADIVQECVVTLEPFSSRIDVPVRETFLPAPDPGDRGSNEIVVDADDPDDPEFFEDGRLDLADLLLELLMVSLEPYPHAPGVALLEAAEDGDSAVEQEDAEGTRSPFAVLGVLRTDRTEP